MLIPGKSHSQFERCNSWVSIETLYFTRVRTFYRRDWSRPGHEEGGDRRPAPDIVPCRCRAPIAACERSIDIAGSGAPKASQNGPGGYRGSTAREAQLPIGPWMMGDHSQLPCVSAFLLYRFTSGTAFRQTASVSLLVEFGRKTVTCCRSVVY